MKLPLFKTMVAGIALAATWGVNAETAFPDGTRLYGYKETGSTAGFYELTPTSPSLFWQDSHFKTSLFSPLRSAWFDEDGSTLCAYAVDYSFGKLLGHFYVTYDWESGELLSSKSLPDFNDPFILYGTLNPDLDYIFGYGYTAEMIPALLKAPASNPGNLETVIEIESPDFCYGMTWNNDTRSLVGVKYDGTLVNVAPDGTQSILFETGVSTAYSTEMAPPSGLAWSPTEKVYYWNPMRNVKIDGDTSLIGTLYRVDPAAGAVTELLDYTGGDGSNYKFLIAHCETPATDAPEAPEITEINFIKAALSGTATFRLPSTNGYKQPLTGRVALKVILDGSQISVKEGEPGSEITVSLDNLSQGLHTLGAIAESGELTSEEKSQKFYVGNDNPVAPGSPHLTYEMVAWRPSSKGAHGGYVDTDAMEYRVCLNEVTVGTTASNTMTVEISTIGPLYHVSASIYAVCNGMESEPAVSNTLLAGDAMEVPFTITPTEAQTELCSYVDDNDDGKGWRYDSEAGAFYSGYSSSEDMDDWLFLPPVNLEEGKIYDFSMLARRRGIAYEGEYIEVKYGLSPTPAAMTKRLIAEYNPEPEYGESTGSIRPDESGKWYIGIHATSLPAQFGMYVKDLKVTYNGVTTSSPAAVEFLRATPAAEGALSATVAFTLPSKLIDGTAIPSSSVIKAVVTGDSETSIEGTPGEKVSVVVRTLQGLNTITVVPFLGEVRGEAATVEVFTGEVIPDSPQNLTATVSPDMKSATLTWSAPVNGTEGGYINPANLTFNVYRLVSTGMGSQWQPIIRELKETTFTYTIDSPVQDYYEFAVTAENIAGTSPRSDTFAMLGTPYTLPIADNFEAGRYSYEPWVTYMPDTSYATQWGILPISSIPVINEDDGIAVAGMGLIDGCLGMAGMPIFSTVDCKEVTLTMRLWTGEDCADNIHITGKCFGMTTPIEVGTVTPNGDWQNVAFKLPDALRHKQWVQLYLNAEFPLGSDQWVVLDDYSITSVSGVKAAESTSYAVRAGVGAIEITVEESSPVAIYAIDGTLLRSLTLDGGTHRIEMIPGVYIVALPGYTSKLIIK